MDYELKNQSNGVYAFLLEGEVSINDVKLERRDGIGITEEAKLTIKANENAEILLMEVPMNH